MRKLHHYAAQHFQNQRKIFCVTQNKGKRNVSLTTLPEY